MSVPHRRNILKRFRTKRSTLCFIIFVLLWFIFFGFYVQSNRGRVYAVVFDVGRTESRVLGFSFRKPYFDGRLVLDSEWYGETKPTFVEQPEQLLKSISILLDQAKQRIPEKYWFQTPLILKAGRHLLKSDPEGSLLREVKALLQLSPFLTNEDSVSIMNGVDEGIFPWFTVNYLLYRLSDNHDQTIAALDLGDGFTQATFTPTPSTLNQTAFIHSVKTVNGVMPVYTHSYLGLGLMAARKGIVTYKHLKPARNLTSLCVHPFFSDEEFQFGGVDYLVSGDYRFNNVIDFDACTEIITNYVFSKVEPLQELHTKEIYAFNYYFDRAADAGLIDPYKGGIVTVQDINEAARTACSCITLHKPFICLDLTYIWVLLEHGFQLTPGTKLNLFKDIRGHEISWALGAAFNELQKDKFIFQLPYFHQQLINN